MGHSAAMEMPGTNDKFTGIDYNGKLSASGRPEEDPLIETILSEGGEDFSTYLRLTGLAGDSNLMVLSSMHHYYYDYSDLKGIRTLINLKELNQVSHLESFLHTLYRILPCQANFIGCFTDKNDNGSKKSFLKPARLFNGLVSFFDSAVTRNLSKTSVATLLENHGFIIIDLTDINGKTFFQAQNIRRLGD